MLAIAFSFPGGRYHATPWGRHVNEADVAWPPEPWRLLRALIASWHRKADPAAVAYADLADLIDALAAEPPHFRLPMDAIHSHVRHYMPQGNASKTLVFDAFARLPASESLVALWPDLTLDAAARAKLAILVDGLAYLGRAESWVEAAVLDDAAAAQAQAQVNCRPVPPASPSFNPASFNPDQESVRVIAPLPAADYADVRAAHIAGLSAAIQARHKGAKPLSLEKAQATAQASPLARTLPERLVDAIALETSALQGEGWSRPPASRELLYVRPPLLPLPRRSSRSHPAAETDTPTVARFVLAGRPRPRLEDTVRIGELMRLATLARYGWETDPASGRRQPKAPPLFSGRAPESKARLADPAHAHVFWLSEDADGDGEIDHITLFARDGFDADARQALDGVTRLWLEKRQRDKAGDEAAAAAPQRQEWRLALEGFGTADDFRPKAENDGGCAFLAKGRVFTSVTPFLAAGHLKPGPNPYEREIRRLLRLRGLVDAAALDQVVVEPVHAIRVRDREIRSVQFHRFRSTRGERQPDAAGTFLKLTLPHPVDGPLCLGYGSHFGLGLFKAAGERDGASDR